MNRYKITLLLLISLFVVALGTTSCKKEKKTEQVEAVENLPDDIVEMRDDQIKIAEIEVGAIENRSLSGTLRVSGTVSCSPQNVASVSVPLGGVVRNTSLVPGNYVSKGQRLAVIENPDYVDIQENYLEAKNKFEYTEADYNRQKELYKNDVSSQKNMQSITSEYKILRVQISALKQKLLVIGINPNTLNENNISRSIVLTSPISGYVKAVNANIGKQVSNSDVLFEIVNNNKLFLELTLFDKDASKVAVGQNIHFFINNETEPHTAKVYQTGKSIEADKTYKIHANITSNCENVMPGMYVNALIETSSQKVTSVPVEAVVNFADKDYIFIFDKEKKENGRNFTEYKMVQIQKGVSDGKFVEINPVENIDLKTVKVVHKGAYNLLSAKKNAGEMAC